MTRLSALGLIALFSLALFTSAALMFSVQPMIGKMLLPIVGGTPAGWIVAMAFFQMALLAGYTLAYGFSRLPARGHAVAYILTLALGGAFLPVAINAQDATETLDAGGTFMLLAITIGLPFVALATTSTTLQRLFSSTSHPAAHDPYFLYAASNLGSFAGLLLYPFLIEPNFTLGQQSEGWFGVYAGLVAMAVICLLSLGGQRSSTAASTAVGDNGVPALPFKRCVLWVAYAFMPASLLMGYTSFITSDIYAAPLIWVVSLSIYLLTFVVAFRSQALLRAQTLQKWHVLAVAVSLVLIILSTSVLRTSLQPVFVHLLALGVIAMAFHLRLYEDRPLGSARQLAAFYLLISLGGALAGLFNAFVAPVIFNASLELPLVLLLSLLLHPAVRQRLRGMDYAALGFALLAVAAFVVSLRIEPTSARTLLYVCVLSLVVCICHPRVLLVAGIAVFAAHLTFSDGDVVARDRNFYGTITVYDRIKQAGDIKYTVRYINHGTTLHGFQPLSGPNHMIPGAYYWTLDELFRRHNPRKTIILGLGTGSMFCFARPGMEFTFIDVDPAVIDAANKHFTHLSGCEKDKPARIIQGDGRLELAKLDDEKFDLIAVDVFSSEYIPAHIATREALGMYMDRLAPGGIIIFHISNNFFDLAPVLAAAAKDAGLEYRLVERFKLKNTELERPSRWFAMTKDASIFDSYTDFEWKVPAYATETRMWTDDFTDYLSVMRDDVFTFKRWLAKGTVPTAKPTPAAPSASD